MGVIEIEYEVNKLSVFTKSDEEPIRFSVTFGENFLFCFN
jgi:hypothetical protein